MNREEIFNEIEMERNYQDEKWGGSQHDDQKSSHDWIAYITKYSGQAVHWPWDTEHYRKQMIRVAALAVAAIEWLERQYG